MDRFRMAPRACFKMSIFKGFSWPCPGDWDQAQRLGKRGGWDHYLQQFLFECHSDHPGAKSSKNSAWPELMEIMM